MDGEKETIIMGAAEVICCFFRRENIHNRPEISEHVHTRVPEVCSVRDNMQVHRVLHEHAYRALAGVRRAGVDRDAAFGTRPR